MLLLPMPLDDEQFEVKVPLEPGPVKQLSESRVFEEAFDGVFECKAGKATKGTEEEDKGDELELVKFT